jgi:drug/metabolite transporter (DMT)-like permease
MVTILALIAALLTGGADFLGGMASRRSSALAVLAVTAPAGLVVMLAASLLTTALHVGGAGLGSVSLASAGWALAGGVAGGVGLIAFYAGFAAAPMSVVAPVTALIATLLPVGVAVAEGERLTLAVTVGAIVCVAAVVCVSAERQEGRAGGRSKASARMKALAYAVPAGASFGLFYLFLRNAGTDGVVWPVTLARVAGTLVAVVFCLTTRTRPLGWRADRATFGIALLSGTLDASANVGYVLATRTGQFGLAVVLTSLYPGVTVLLARYVFGERMRWVQRAGLIMAGVGVVLVTAPI